VLRSLVFQSALAVMLLAACSRPADEERLSPSVAAGRGRGDVPLLKVPRRSSTDAVTIDGDLGDEAWKRAARAGPFVNAGTGEPDPGSPVQGSALLLWDDAFLYVGFDVGDRDVRGGFPAGAEDPHLWERDTTEIMLDPDGDGDNVDYYEIQINPQNLVFDSRFDRYNAPRGGPNGPFGRESWRSGVTSAVVVQGTIDDTSSEDGGYVVEAKIPWASFDRAERAPPRPGDTWRANFYAMEDNGGVAWSPILGQGNFHRASRFGRVTFGE
jgi:hypothetical protein